MTYSTKRRCAELIIVLTAIIALSTAAQADVLPNTTWSLTSLQQQTTIVQKCATQEQSAALAAQIEAGNQAWLRSQPLNQRVAPASKTIYVFFHVITDAAGKKGVLSDGQLQQQVAVLNKAYAGAFSDKSTPTGFTFVLKGHETRKSGPYFGLSAGSSEDLSMKRQLRFQPEAANILNVYTVNGGDQLGWSTFPWDFSKKKSIDGIVISYTTVPGGKDTAPEYSQGKTLAHETGHWLGMYHTFQGGCSLLKGDHVEDTVPELDPSYGCPINRRTCVDPKNVAAWTPILGKNFTDPTNNFMDYSFDACTNTFTKGQVARMNMMWQRFRSVPQPLRNR